MEHLLGVLMYKCDIFVKKYFVQDFDFASTDVNALFQFRLVFAVR